MIYSLDIFHIIFYNIDEVRTMTETYDTIENETHELYTYDEIEKMGYDLFIDKFDASKVKIPDKKRFSREEKAQIIWQNIWLQFGIDTDDWTKNKGKKIAVFQFTWTDEVEDAFHDHFKKWMKQVGWDRDWSIKLNYPCTAKDRIHFEEMMKMREER